MLFFMVSLVVMTLIFARDGAAHRLGLVVFIQLIEEFHDVLGSLLTGVLHGRPGILTLIGAAFRCVVTLEVIVDVDRSLLTDVSAVHFRIRGDHEVMFVFAAERRAAQRAVRPASCGVQRKAADVIDTFLLALVLFRFGIARAEFGVVAADILDAPALAAIGGLHDFLDDELQAFGRLDGVVGNEGVATLELNGLLQVLIGIWKPSAEEIAFGGASQSPDLAIRRDIQSGFLRRIRSRIVEPETMR